MSKPLIYKFHGKEYEYTPLKNAVPYRERIAVVMLPSLDFRKKGKTEKDIILTDTMAQNAFKQAYSTPLHVEQANALKMWEDWPHQAIVVGVGKTILEEDNESLHLHVGDRVYLRGQHGLMMLVEGQLVCLITWTDIYLVAPISEIDENWV